MTDLRCDAVIHAKALGSIVELKCREHSRRLSAPGRKVSVFHRWEYRGAYWEELNDRIVVQEDSVQGPVQESVQDAV